MKSVLFLMTHENVNWKFAKEVIQKHSDIDVFVTGNEYHHYDDIQSLTSLPHKTNNSKSIWCDVLFRNEQFTCKGLIKHCKFIYLHLSGDETNYYNWRLSGMKQYYNKTGGVWIDESSDIDLGLLSIF